MAYINLVAEMAKNNISIEQIARSLNVHRNSASNKVNGRSSFTIEQAEKIHDEFFPKLSIKYLFARSEEVH